MQAANGVRFESKEQGWKAVLPAGPYLPEDLVVEKGPLGLSAHLHEPVDRVTLSCREGEDGLVRVLFPGSWQSLLFRPDTKEYGIESGYAGWVRQETRMADGSLHFCAAAGQHRHDAVQSPDGRVEATSRQGERVRHGASVKDGQIHFLPVRSLSDCLREEGLISGLFSCAASQFNTPVSFALEAGRAELCSDLKAAIETAREQALEESRLPESLLSPPTGNGVGLFARSVVLAGVSLRTAGRCRG